MNLKISLDKKKLIRLAIIIIIVVIALIIALGKTSSMDKGNTNFIKQNEFKSNSKKLVDYGENVMQFGDDTYLLDKASKSIYRINNGLSKEVLHFNTEPSEKFFIRSNKLIFSYDNTTYYSELDGSNVKKFTNGEVTYVDDDVYMFISHQTTKDELYITSYDNKTFRTTNEISSNLATGNSIKYLKNNDKKVYYTSISSNDKLAILEVDVESRLDKVVTRIPRNAGYAGMYYEISDILKVKDDYYFVANEMTFTTNENDIWNYSYLYKRNIEDSSEEVIDENVGPYLYYYSKNKSELLYEKYDEEKSIWQIADGGKSTNFEWEELRYGDVTNYFSLQGSYLAKDGEDLANIGINTENYLLEKVVRLDNGYYFSIKDEYENTIWYYFNEIDSKLIKIF